MSVGPVWEVQEDAGATTWSQVRLTFTDGAEVAVVAVVSGGRVCLEEVRARPALSLDDLTVLADWLEGPLAEACGAGEGPVAEGGARRARPGWPRGSEGRWLVAREYRTAQEQGADPVLAVMRATGHSRHGALRLIAGARDAGFLNRRHARPHRC
ncbi:DUF6214 family protein [Streptomyces flavalbus]|uniref:DUF6214 family protein n=1 Tax=Streptomyces flavalbus TaxID=2665155 RepID=A0ABW2W1L7_9ACTN